MSRPIADIDKSRPKYESVRLEGDILPMAHFVFVLNGGNRLYIVRKRVVSGTPFDQDDVKFFINKGYWKVVPHE